MESDRPRAGADALGRRLEQLETLVGLLRAQQGRAQRQSGGAGLTPEELRKAAATVDRLVAAIDRELDPRLRAARAHGESLARDVRATGKLNSCVAGLLSARTLAGGLAAPKPCSRLPQTVFLQ
ncbi:hypothetical protein Rsub_10356 [Raphidocelis subcapitata]|uniref:Uncharacterized protein n=1 Tax=Raphidocelis subcapitata TaxID=307507 RepID=A0A2V0PCA5_9CHLO|nr:hypothetical protein Rsub_10356 [Raphidocelis subcapitata]|eukprot:GBF97169.1 hypothetical protein Rsub_10356 [Raphidocelis subcapitata]